MEKKEFYRKRMRYLLFMSPFMFCLSIWGVVELLQFFGVYIKKEGIYIAGFIAFIICYVSLYLGMRKFYLTRIK